MSTRRDDVRSAVEVYIDAMHVTLFLDWDVSTEEGRGKAIEKVTDMWLALEALINKSVMKNAFALGVADGMDIDAPRNWVDEDNVVPMVDHDAPPEVTDAYRQGWQDRRVSDEVLASMKRHPSYMDVGTDREDEYLDDLTDRINAAAADKAKRPGARAYQGTRGRVLKAVRAPHVEVHPAAHQRVSEARRGALSDEPGKSWGPPPGDAAAEARLDRLGDS